LDGTRALLEIVVTPPHDWLKFGFGRRVREMIVRTSDAIMLMRTQMSFLEEIEVVI
jgi:hypothetical protein